MTVAKIGGVTWAAASKVNGLAKASIAKVDGEITVITWLNAFGPYTPNLAGGGYTGTTIRQVFKAAQISNAGLANFRATFYAAPAEALTISKAYVQAAGGGDAYDFSTTPVQLLFSGGAGFAIGVGANIVSDTLAFSIPAATDLVISMYVNGDATHDGVYAKNTGVGTGNRSYFIAGDDAATVNTSGYTALTDDIPQPILRLEAG